MRRAAAVARSVVQRALPEVCDIASSTCRKAPRSCSTLGGVGVVALGGTAYQGGVGVNVQGGYGSSYGGDGIDAFPGTGTSGQGYSGFFQGDLLNVVGR